MSRASSGAPADVSLASASGVPTPRSGPEAAAQAAIQEEAATCPETVARPEASRTPVRRAVEDMAAPNSRAI